MARSSIMRLLALCLALTILAACSPMGAAAPAAPGKAEDTRTPPAEPATIFAPDEATSTPLPTPAPTPLNPLTIEALRGIDLPGSEITIDQTLAPGSNYHRYIASYRSEGLKIYALLTVPQSARPPTGFPVIVFNHGYIPPEQYRTTERYVAYVDAFASHGYIVFKSDYRGHGQSEGKPTGGYGSPAYTIDVLNAVAALKHYPAADAHRIGMWGHSMGGQITLRAMVVSRDIKAGVIWSGVVAPYADLLNHWRRGNAEGSTIVPEAAHRWRAQMVEQYGTPEQNPAFWNSISPNSALADLSGPLQLHHSPTDPEVPFAFSQTLLEEVKAAGKSAELYSYPGDDHNLSRHLALALQRSVAFFDQWVKRNGS